MARRIRQENEQQDRIQKSITLSIAVSLFFLILLFRLFILQVINAQTNIRLSQENQMRLKILKAPRGRLFDRTGVVLARNRPSYSVYILPSGMKKNIKLIPLLTQIHDSENNPVFDSLDLVKKFTKARYRKFDLTRIKEDVSLEIVSIIEEHSIDLPGVVVQTEARREYPMGDCTFHVLGYMSEIPESQYAQLKKRGYLYGDHLGKAGIEKQYEHILRGRNGSEYIEVNAYGKSLGIIKKMPRVDPIAGNDITLSLYGELQEITARAFPDTLRGAVVAIDPRTGEVLVMYSCPSVDANIFSLSTELRTKYWAEAAMDTSLPLNNRATSGTYTPGSTFKPISSLASLASGKIKANDYMPVSCKGAYRFGRRVAHCWKLSGHGKLNMRGALQKSCNIYYYQLGLIVGDKIINTYADMFGLGQLTGIDLPHERKGWLSGEEAYNERFSHKGWKWTKGIVLDHAIGQTQVVTPLQLAMMIGGMGNGKSIYKPFLKKKVQSRNGSIVEQTEPTEVHTLNIDKNIMNTLRLALVDVFMPGGTGGRARVPGIPVGGKTGSAQNPHGEKTHALFIACAPIENPVIAVTVVVENAGHGGSVAAPIAGEILRHYFSKIEEGKTIVEFYKNKKPEMF